MKYLIWIQGESDNNTDVDYIRQFNIFRDNLFSGISNKQLQKAKWIITQTSICGNKRDHVLNAQQKKLAQRDKVYITKVTDSLVILFQ